jgi:hypothetical protein
MSEIRGIRDNNPGNIRHGQKWIGLSPIQTDASFDQFISPEYGIRAIAKILFSYSNRGLDSVRDIITTWAPDAENNTVAYIKAVCESTGYSADTHLDLTNETVVVALVKAIILQENGQQPYDDDVVTNGVHMAFTSQ